MFTAILGILGKILGAILIGAGSVLIGGGSLWLANKKLEFIKIVEVPSGQVYVTKKFGKINRILTRGKKYKLFTYIPGLEELGEIETVSMIIPTKPIKINPEIFKQLPLHDNAYFSPNFTSYVQIKGIEDGIIIDDSHICNFYDKVMSEAKSTDGIIKDPIASVENDIVDELNNVAEIHFKKRTLKEIGDPAIIEQVIQDIRSDMNDFLEENYGLEMTRLGTTEIKPSENIKEAGEKKAIARFDQETQDVKNETDIRKAEAKKKIQAINAQAAREAADALGISTFDYFRLSQMREAAENGGKVVIVQPGGANTGNDIAAQVALMQGITPEEPEKPGKPENPSDYDGFEP